MDVKAMDDPILLAREKRQVLIRSILDDNTVVVIIKANTPGKDKNHWTADVLTDVFRHETENNIDVDSIEHYRSDDGPFYLVKIRDINADDVKRKLVELEETHPLGRLIDLDVYTEYGALSRNMARECFFCRRPYYICRRQGSHTVNQLLEFIERNVRAYLTGTIRNLINQAVMCELDLHPKFGLVTPLTRGSHHDMDYGLMVRAKEAILPYFIEMFDAGLTKGSLEHKFIKAKKIGIEAEKSMFEATGGANAYKGLIFILGLVLVSLGHVMVNGQDKDWLFENIKVMGEYSLKEIDSLKETPGIVYFREYGFKGARGEALSGLSSVRKALEILEKYRKIDEEALTMTLIHIIGTCDDSVLLKRSGSMEKYLYNKKLITSIEKYDIDKIDEVTSYCINNNLSVGGSADLLVAAVFIHLLEKTLI